jgi:hypothetical protein
MLQLAAEEGRARRVIEGQRGERVDHAMAAGVLAVEGLDADDGHDVARRHAVLLLGARQRAAVGAPELDAAGDARLGDELRAVVLPHRLLGRRADQVEDGVAALHAREHRVELALDEAVALHHLVDERAYLLALAVVLRVRAYRKKRYEKESQARRSSRTRRRRRAAPGRVGCAP